MKKIIGVSIGSSKRDHSVKVNLLGEDFEIKRIGTDGSLEKAKQMLKELDGKVDAFGLGGIDLYFVADDKKYLVRDAAKLAKVVKQTPVVDGSGLKHTLEREVIHYLEDNNIIKFKDKKVLMVAAIDRFGMAESFVEVGAKIVFGDLIFGLGIPIPLRKYSTYKFLARILLPILSRLPFKVLYPTGSKQDKQSNKNKKWYDEADIIAGDFLLINKYLPPKLTDKIIITNTTTEDDVRQLKERGLKMLITTTPVFNSRSFGTNVMEATIIAAINKDQKNVTPQDYIDYLEKLDYKPRIERLN